MRPLTVGSILCRVTMVVVAATALGCSEEETTPTQPLAENVMSSDPLSFARDDYSTSICEAIRTRDFESVESLRDGPVADYLPDLIRAYGMLDDWESKDLIIHLVQDCSDERLTEVMRDALDSPTPETRAIAVCVLRSDYSLFESFIVDGFVNADRVDEEIARFRNE